MSSTPRGKSKGKPDWLNGLTSAVYGGAGMPGKADESERVNLINGTPIQRSQGDPAKEGPATLQGQAFVEVKAFFLDTKLNLLLLALPFAIISKAAKWGDGATFVLSMLALCPLAERLGFITEQLAMYTNDTLGGLLNASFGNATEVIISGFALQHGYRRIVQLSLLGSVVGNLLLVLGTAFIAGGVKQKHQTFNQQGINVNCGLLLLATVAVMLPSLLSETKTQARENGNASELLLSRFESVFLLVCYGCYLLFQLYTHRYLYEEQDEGGSQKRDSSSGGGAAAGVGGSAALQEAGGGIGGGGSDDEEGGLSGGQRVRLASGTGGDAARHGSGREMELTVRRTGDGRSLSGRSVNGGAGPSRGAAGLPASGSGRREEIADVEGASEGSVSGAGAESDDEEDELVLSKVGCFIWLTIVTLFIALLSEWIMDAIKGASKALHIPMPFLVTILLPIVGNAAEHASAIVFAYKNRIEIALGVAVGSSTQISVLVIPFCVVLAWMMGQPLDLNFNAFEACVYFLAVLLACITVMDGNSNWLKGVLLLVTYVLVAAGFWMHKDTDLSQEDVDAAHRHHLL